MRVTLCLLASISLLAVGCVGDEPPEVGSPIEAAALLAVGPPGSYQVSPVPKRSSGWSYDDTGVDRGTAWRTGTGGWATGQAPFGYGETYVQTVTAFGPDAAHKRPTTYFRHAFVKNSGRVLKMYLRVMYDDGFVFYLNGHEGGRASMPSGAVGYATYALGHEAEDRYVTYDISSQIANLSDASLNTLAVEVHQASDASSDLVFDAQLVMWMEGTLDYPAQGRIERGDLWTFWSQASSPGAAWRQPGFDTSGWQSGNGPLGYGEAYLTTEFGQGPLTTYFRKDFTVEGSLHGIFADVMYDDGFVAYLNGTEIGRASMPAGAVTVNTLALGHEAGAAYQRFDWSAAIPLIQPGRNTLAIELHNASATSSDAVFDLGLVLEGGWTQQDSGVTSTLRAIAATGATHASAVGDGGVLVTTSDGVHWTRHDPQPGVTTDLAAIVFPWPDRGVIAGDAGTILTSDDAGATWTARASGTTADVADLAYDGDTVWAVDGSATLRRSLDGGLTWSALPTGTVGAFTSVAFADQAHGWLAGDVDADGDRHAVIYGTADGGATWTEQWQASHHGDYLFDLDRTEPTKAWAVGEVSLSGQGDHKLRTTDGTTWSALPPATADFGNVGVDFIDGNRGWAVGVAGQITRTNDGGATWITQRAPLYGQLPWLHRVSFADAVHGWAVGEQGAIMATTTGGD